QPRLPHRRGSVVAHPRTLRGRPRTRLRRALRAVARAGAGVLAPVARRRDHRAAGRRGRRTRRGGLARPRHRHRRNDMTECDHTTATDHSPARDHSPPRDHRTAEGACPADERRPNEEHRPTLDRPATGHPGPASEHGPANHGPALGGSPAIGFEDASRVLDAQPFAELVGTRLLAFGDGAATLEVPIRPQLHQQFGYVHGGVLAYLADNALTFAAGTVLGANVLTGGFSVTYLRPASGQRL